MACGVPVVSTDGGALPEVVGDAGIVVPVKDASALAANIEKLCTDSELNLHYAVQGRKRIEEKFSWRLAAQQMTALYCGVIDANR